MPTTPQLYGLLIGIDDYPVPVPPLGGCVNDIRKIKKYLENKQQDLKPNLMVLENEAATKEAIIEGFQKHLAQAGPEDTAIVYFSGHGTQEDTDPEIWPFESDGKLECIVNYDGIIKQGDTIAYNLLADKELRFLLHQLGKTQAHIITIFDCCHSGGNTREAKLEESEKKVSSRRYVTSRLTKACPKRTWDQFLFAEQVDPKELASQPISKVIPVGQHVQMGACRSDQLAYEVDGGGVFTSRLLSLLESTDGTITYFDLRSRIRYMVKNEYKQTPQVYVQGEEGKQLFSGFLGRPVTRQLNEGNFIHNKDEGWILDLGAMHGVSPELGSVQVEDPDGEPFMAKVKSVKMSYTRLLISDPEVMTRLDPTKAYRVLVPGVLAQPIRIYLDMEGDEKSTMEKEMSTFKDRLLVVESEQMSDYVIRVKNNAFTITLPLDPDRPVVQPTESLSEKAAAFTTIYLRNIAKWHFVRDLYNPDVRLFNKLPIEIEFLEVKNDLSQVALPLEGEEIVLPYRKIPSGEWGNMIRIKITNRHSSRIYCSLIYLSEEFQVYSSLLGEPVIFLDPGESVWAYGGGDIELDLADHIKALNWPNSFIWLKFMVSTQGFDPATFDQDPLPMPNASANRGMKLATPGKFEASDWTTKLVTIRMPNPEFKDEEA